MPAARKLTIEEVCAHVRKGDLDGGYADISASYVARIVERGGTMAWKIALGDLEVSEEDMTLGDFKRVAELCKCSWREVNPVDDMGHLVYVLANRKAQQDATDIRSAVDAIEAMNVHADLRVTSHEVDIPLGSTTTTP